MSKKDYTNLFDPNIGDDNLSFYVNTNDLRQFKAYFDGKPIGAVSNWSNVPEKRALVYCQCMTINVCSIKFRSKRSTVLLLCLLRNLMEQTLQPGILHSFIQS